MSLLRSAIDILQNIRQSIRLLLNTRVKFSPNLDAYEEEEEEERCVFAGDGARFVCSMLAPDLLRRPDAHERGAGEEGPLEGGWPVSDVTDAPRFCGLKMVRRSLKMEKYSWGPKASSPRVGDGVYEFMTKGYRVVKREFYSESRSGL